MAKALIFIIRLYQWGLSPWLGFNCRFSPSCSHYCSESIAKHGFARGGYLGVCRIARCHPWCEGGHDPVP